MEDIWQQKFISSFEGLVKELVVYNVIASGKMGFTQVSVVGTSGGYFGFLDGSIEWVGESIREPQKGWTVIPDYLALKLGVSIGDDLILECHTKDGLVNTAHFSVGGIFRGNKYIIENRIYITQEEAQDFIMENKVTTLHVYLKNYQEDTFTAIESWLVPFGNAISVGITSKHPENVGIFPKIFDFYHDFFTLFVWMFSFVFLFILYLGVQNMVFLRFHERKEEIVSLMAFGMRWPRFLMLVFWEFIFFLGGALFIGYALSLLFAKLVSMIKVMDISSEMVVVVGGPSLSFNLYFKDVIFFALFIAAILFIGTFVSVIRYFSREVKDICHGVY
ncbi:MAG: hypothetical protein N2Z76_10135 [Treponemataceae bacterium]|nr:hypothetical protein [Treponemataceae bacterium]